VVTDANGCKHSLELPSLIFATAPLASFNVDTLTCPKALVNFNNTSNAVNFTSNWSFGDGGTSNVNSPSHSYLNTGYYTVNLLITDQYGCSDDTSVIMRSDNPLASFTVSDSITSCAPFEVIFTNTSQFYRSAYWMLNGGNSTAANPVQYYNLPGTYLAKLYVTSPGGCIDSAQKTITVYDTIGTKITYLPLDGCKPLPIDINAFSKGPMNYTWDFGDGNIINTDQSNYQHIYRSFGEFIPKVIMTDPSGCVFAVPGPDTIRLKGADAKFGYDKKLFCDSGYVSFTDSSTFNDPIVSYNWNFGDGNISAVQEPIHRFDGPGIYSVSLSVLTQAGCKDTMNLKDIIKVVQSPMIGITGDSVICVHERLLNGGEFLRSDTSAVNWQCSITTIQYCREFPNYNHSKK
jgi:PKD repeat protein